MGQYYKIVNLDKEEYIEPHAFGDGAKLMEFGNSGAGSMLGLAVLLASGNDRGGGDLHSDNSIIGTWAGDRIVVAGDYDDDGRYLSKKQIEKFAEKHPDSVSSWEAGNEDEPFTLNLYVYAGDEYSNVSDFVLDAISDDGYVKQSMADSLSWNKKNVSEHLQIKLWGKVEL